jgi:hypothetical protein
LSHHADNLQKDLVQSWATESIRAIVDELEQARAQGRAPPDIDAIADTLASWLESNVIQMRFPFLPATQNPNRKADASEADTKEVDISMADLRISEKRRDSMVETTG